jgi:hypothetical protein
MFSTGDLTDLNNASYFNVQYLQIGQFDGNSMVLLRISTLKEPISINDPERYGVNLSRHCLKSSS